MVGIVSLFECKKPLGVAALKPQGFPGAPRLYAGSAPRWEGYGTICYSGFRHFYVLKGWKCHVRTLRILWGLQGKGELGVKVLCSVGLQ